MSVLATKISKSMINRAGYIPIETIVENGGFLGMMDEDFMYYTFKDCLKVDTTNFHQWVCYWEGYPFAIVCDVKADKLSNGYTKVAVLSKTVVAVSDIGDFPSKRNLCFGNMLNGKFLLKSGLQEYVNNNLGKSDIVITSNVQTKKQEKAILSNNEIKNLKEVMERNWGVSLK